MTHRDPTLDRVTSAPGEFAGRSLTVRQRERFQDFQDLVVRLQLVPPTGTMSRPPTIDEVLRWDAHALVKPVFGFTVR